MAYSHLSDLTALITHQPQISSREIPGDVYFKPLRDAVGHQHYLGKCSDKIHDEVQSVIESAIDLYDSGIPSNTVLSTDASAVHPGYALYRQLLRAETIASRLLLQYQYMYDGKFSKAEELNVRERFTAFLGKLSMWRRLLDKSNTTDKSRQICSTIRKDWRKNWPHNKEEIAQQIFHLSADELDGNYVGSDEEKEEEIRQELEYYSKRQAKQRERLFCHRVTREMIQRVNEGWYCYMNTLTVDNDHLDEVFFTDVESRWKQYIKNTETAIRKSLGDQTAQKLKVSEFHRYAAVVELGEKTGRPHYHVIHMCKELPYGASDPTQGVRSGHMRYRARIEAISGFWPNGISFPKAIRVSPTDAYAQAGWQWPYQNGKPMVNNGVGAAANYLAKYIAKSYEDPQWKQSGTPRYRTKMSQGLGLQAYKNMMRDLPEEALYTYCQTPELLLTLRIPGSHWDRPQIPLIRREATREWIRRQEARKNNIGKTIEMLSQIPTRMNIVKRLSLMYDIRNIKIPPGLASLNIGNTLIQSMIPMGTSEEDQRAYKFKYEELVKAAIAKYFPTDDVVGKRPRGG